jgi:hypothetical protein
MPLKTYASQAEVPEAQRAAAVEAKDGKWIVAEDDVGDAGKKALDAERDARRKADDKARAADDAKKALEQQLADLRLKADAAAKGITEAELQKIRDTEAAKIKPIEEALAKAKAENRKLKLTDRVKALALANGVMPDRIDKAMKDLDGRVDLTEDGESIVVKDATGKVTATTIEDFLKTEYRKEAKFFYKGTGSTGSGSEGSEGDGGDGSSYDPVAAGKAAAKEQKKSITDNALAFK